MEKITVDAKVENLAAVTEFIISSMEEKDCSVKILMQTELVMEELFVNVASYAYEGGTGSCTVCKELEENPSAIVVTFIDSGTPYNPLEHKDPDTGLTLEERSPGGLGIFLVKKNVDEIFYEHKDGKNILTFKKLF